MRIGVVVIGRNEGERLRRCLQSLGPDTTGTAIYVDSGSTDGSADLARSLGIEVVELNCGSGFTAARARNAGFERLISRDLGVSLVQFVDGDCEVNPGWLRRAEEQLGQEGDVAIVCGRRRERFPGASPYNRLCDLEWDTPVGEAASCGGDFMARAEAFRQVGGFNPAFIAGEEPELCLRLRARGWRILRIDAEMTLHDAAMTSLRQWWLRTVRSGHAAAETAWTHGLRSGRQGLRPVLSFGFWGLLLPVAALLLAWPTRGAALLLLAAYPLQWWRIARHRGSTSTHSRAYAAFILLGKLPQAVGGLRFFWSRLRGRRESIIEYKGRPD